MKDCKFIMNAFIFLNKLPLIIFVATLNYEVLNC
jgi:hypothetical protein